MIFLFSGLFILDVFPQKAETIQQEVARFIKEGKNHYTQGEYDKALVQFIEAKDLIEEMEPKARESLFRETAEIFFNLALTYYAVGGSERNREWSREYLRRYLEKAPDTALEEILYPQGFVEMFRQIQRELVKPEAKVKVPTVIMKPERAETKKDEKKSEEKEKPSPEQKPIVKKKAGEPKKPHKKKKSPWLVIGGLIVAGGAAAAVFLLGVPKTGTIEVNSTPSSARVYLDGSDTGKDTNCTLSDIKEGSHRIKLVKEGYVDYQQTLTVEKEKTVSVNADLNDHTITVTSPEEGNIWLKGDEVEICWSTGNGTMRQSGQEDINALYGEGIYGGELSHLSKKWMLKNRMMLRKPGVKKAYSEKRTEAMESKHSKKTNMSLLQKVPGYPHLFPSRSTPHSGRRMEDVFSPSRIISEKGLYERESAEVSPRSPNHSGQSTALDQTMTISNVKIEIYRDGNLVKTITSSTSNDGSHTWTVSDDFSDANNFIVRVSCVGEDGIFGESATFRITDLLHTIDWVEIPAGWFKMGDNRGFLSELPVHDVYLDGYYLSKFEVTFDQYDRFCDDTGRTNPSDSGWGRGQMPVINVSWDDAKAYCDWLSNKTGEDIHLPTEAQWEKAARGIDQRMYPWGNSDPNCNKTNYYDCQNKSVTIGSYPSGKSPYGIYDMAGNIDEWCHDWYSSDYYDSSPSHNPQGPSSGTFRVTRGGSWFSFEFFIRSTYRGPSSPSFGYNTIGIRLCREK
ncbi:MAG: SUMF1/EgtB/PvdO family nonheme iron enzyme [Candidatus Aminicenantes bacterium]|nr:SUMF1/EgtB/PvdO family nonheme iron enzyme [Candidatus Aminicenantes bacterium]